jgi:DNA-binding IclR family transcriptional regulator
MFPTDLGIARPVRQIRRVPQVQIPEIQPVERLDERRTCGLLRPVGERDPEAASAAVPVIDDQGKLRGALLASAIRTRFDGQAQKTELKALKSEAQTLAGSLPASEA